jgi:hypothetical protein
MSGDAQWLIEAIEQKHLLIYSRRGNTALLEPQAYALRRGNQEVVIAYVVKGNTHIAERENWLVLGIGENLLPDSRKQFSVVREIPRHIQEQVQAVYYRAKAK